MASLDTFNSDAFKMLSLTQAVDKVPFLPSLLGDMMIFEDKPIRTTAVMIESRSGVLTLIQSDQRGSPPKSRKSELRDAKYFSTVRLAQSDRMTASEVQDVRAFGSETEFMQLQAEVARRLSGPTGIQRNIEYTWEYHRLGAIQGVVMDADGTSIIKNWFTEFQIAVPDEFAFDLSNGSAASGAIREKATQVVRAMQRAAKGVWLPTTKVVALCGDAFWDKLVAAKEVRETYLNWQQAEALRGPAAWAEGMYYGGIYWINYRGSDDGSEVAIQTDKAKFFPVGAPGVFQVAWAPHDSWTFANTLGKPIYPDTIIDRDRDQYVDIEAYSYPLFYCTRPAMLLSARRGA